MNYYVIDYRLSHGVHFLGQGQRQKVKDQFNVSFAPQEAHQWRLGRPRCTAYCPRSVTHSLRPGSNQWPATHRANARTNRPHALGVQSATVLTKPAERHILVTLTADALTNFTGEKRSLAGKRSGHCFANFTVCCIDFQFCQNFRIHCNSELSNDRRQCVRCSVLFQSWYYVINNITKSVFVRNELH